jgi:hypothetical protein
MHASIAAAQSPLLAIGFAAMAVAICCAVSAATAPAAGAPAAAGATAGALAGGAGCQPVAAAGAAT